MSDWSGTYSCARAIKAGLDLEVPILFRAPSRSDIQMPGPSTVRGPAVSRALVAGKLTIEDLDKRALKVLELVKRAQQGGIEFDAPQRGVDTPQLREVCKELKQIPILMV
jgi:beta-glucosidase